MSVLADNYWYIVPAAVAGIAGDVINRYVTGMAAGRRARILAAAVPGLAVAGYLVAVALTQGGWGWSLHMVLGAPLLAAAVGLCSGFVAFPEPVSPEAPA